MGIVQNLKRAFASTADAEGWTDKESYDDNIVVTVKGGVPAEAVKAAGAPGEDPKPVVDWAGNGYE